MSLFKSASERELDSIILKLNMNLSNNYKDNAQANLRELEDALKRFTEEGKLKEKKRLLYESELGVYREKLKGYAHKDQKPYWT